ncbi:MAG: TatD family hydrolase [Thermoplasmata archaeon]
MIDSHTHLHYSGYSEIRDMSISGITYAITCAVGTGASSLNTYKDEIENMINLYWKLGESLGIKIYSAIGIHPANIPADWKEKLSSFEPYFNHEHVVAIGEVGINSERSVEDEVFYEMARLGKKYDLPLIVHTPFKDREKIVKKEIDILEKSGISPDIVVIDHVNMDILNTVKQGGYHIGLTVKEGRLTPEDVYKNIEIYEDGMLNSDVANLGPSDPLSVPKTVQYLRSRGIKYDTINRISHENAAKFYRRLR